ncbi:phosphoribulokinase [Bradyrhizobium sp. RDM4]|uniref:phosphoribulokinase n=1 Tax=Bradyrhizobium sp. RDM4 TaxID=3378765 RepID=UPI0038FC9429
MSRKHPIISITGSSGAGTTSVKKTFEQIFFRERVNAVYIEGDAFHRYDRTEMRTQMAKEADCGNKHFSHFSPETNLFEELERAFRDYGETGTAVTRHYVHDAEEAALHGAAPGTFTEWERLPENSDLLFYEGLHGAVVTDKVNVARYADLKIGVVPVINLEWIQKLHRDRSARGYSTEAVTDTILRRMPDYIHYICPQFTDTDINFQRVPTVDTSNPFIARWIPTPDEIDGRDPLQESARHRLPYLLSMLPHSFMSRANSIVCPGAKLDLAMQLILTPLIMQLIERKRNLK